MGGEIILTIQCKGKQASRKENGTSVKYLVFDLFWFSKVEEDLLSGRSNRRIWQPTVRGGGRRGQFLPYTPTSRTNMSATHQVLQNYSSCWKRSGLATICYDRPQNGKNFGAIFKFNSYVSDTFRFRILLLLYHFLNYIYIYLCFPSLAFCCNYDASFGVSFMQASL